MIGMNAFIVSAPDSFTSPSTALPMQVYIWADSPERGFVSRASAATLVLLAFLICMNGHSGVAAQENSNEGGSDECRSDDGRRRRAVRAG